MRSAQPISAQATEPLRRARVCLFLTALTVCALFVHGYHPIAEDGGLYVAGVQYCLDHALFPHDTAFVTAHLSYSIFAPALAMLVRTCHLPLEWLLFAVYLGSLWLTLFAAWRIAASLFTMRAAVFGTAAFCAALTIPIAGTSLLLVDPYVTARTVSTPLSLLAVASLLRKTVNARSGAVVCLTAAAVFHPLMGLYAASLAVAVALALHPGSRKHYALRFAVAALPLFAAALLQMRATPESPAARLADHSRYYWFLAQWQWYELLGLAGPLIVIAVVLRLAEPADIRVRALCKASLACAVVWLMVAAFFAQEHLVSHAVARLQPLRAFLLVYAIMLILLAGSLIQWVSRRFGRVFLPAATVMCFALAAGMCIVQRHTFPASQHIELPGSSPKNPWTQAFIWARTNTRPDALFALDANYIGIPGEDAQTFRATARRSMLADFSKDGGEAAITPALAPRWLAESRATAGLSMLDDDERDRRLGAFRVEWLVLRSAARTKHPCPYDNGVVKVCSNSRTPPAPPPL